MWRRLGIFFDGGSGSGRALYAVRPPEVDILRPDGFTENPGDPGPRVYDTHAHRGEPAPPPGGIGVSFSYAARRVIVVNARARRPYSATSFLARYPSHARPFLHFPSSPLLFRSCVDITLHNDSLIPRCVHDDASTFIVYVYLQRTYVNHGNFFFFRNFGSLFLRIEFGGGGEKFFRLSLLRFWECEFQFLFILLFFFFIDFKTPGRRAIILSTSIR